MTGPFEVIKPVPSPQEREKQREVKEGRMARLQRDAQVRRQRVLDAAWTLMADVGLQAVNMRDLGARVGYTAGALYSYFPSRAHLLAAMRQQVFDDLADQQAAAKKPTLKSGALKADRAAITAAGDAYEGTLLSWWQVLCQDPYRLDLLLQAAGPAESDSQGGKKAQPDLLDELFEATRHSLDSLKIEGVEDEREYSTASAVHRDVLSFAIGLLVTRTSACGSAAGCAALTACFLAHTRLMRAAAQGAGSDVNNGYKEGPDTVQIDLFSQSPSK